MLHELLVDDGVEDFGDDWKEGDGAVVLRNCDVTGLVDLDDLGDLDRVWVLVFHHGLIEESCEVWCHEFGYCLEDCWLDAEDVAGFVFVQCSEELFYLFDFDWFDFKLRTVVGRGWCCDAVFLLLGDCEAGSVSNGDVLDDC